MDVIVALLAVATFCAGFVLALIHSWRIYFFIVELRRVDPALGERFGLLIRDWSVRRELWTILSESSVQISDDKVFLKAAESARKSWARFRFCFSCSVVLILLLLVLR